MLTKRIIPCLDVKDGVVVKGVQFRNHEIVGDILEMAHRYSQAGADELVFYDITASSDERVVSKQWIADIAQRINIPFCVAGGIKTVDNAKMVLNYGADKISINSPAINRPSLITDIANLYGSQCVVVGIDSHYEDGDYYVYQYTGDPTKTVATRKRTADWIAEVQDRGAGEIVLNCMNQDGVRQGYDIQQLAKMRDITHIPLIASGGAGAVEHFEDVFQKTDVDGALAASVFHKNIIPIPALKTYLNDKNIKVRK